MFRLVVLSVLVAAVVAAPGYLQTVPVATSHQQRVDVIESSPILTKFLAPDVHDYIVNDHSEEHFTDYEEDSHNIHLASPLVNTIVIAAPETVKTVSSHHEIHQVHDTPVDDIKIIDVVPAPTFESVAVEVAPHYIAAPLVATEVESDHEDVHHLASPFISAVESVESHHEVHQIHDSPVVQQTISHVVAPIIVSHEEVPQVYHEIPVLHSLPLEHSARTNLHPGLSVETVHDW